MKKILPIVISLIVFLCVSGCYTLKSNSIRKSSPLRDQFERGIGSKDDEEKARQAVLTEIPFGSTETEVREYIERNFSESINNKKILSEHRFREKFRKYEHLAVRTNSSVRYAYGIMAIHSVYAEIVFFLEDDILKDVVVHARRTSL